MQSHQIPNYFRDLDIQPTLDFDIIKNAFEGCLRKERDNKGGTKERVQNIVRAFEFLKDEKNRENCYQVYGSNPGPRIPSAAKPAIVKAPPEDFRRFALATPGQRVKIYITLNINITRRADKTSVDDELDKNEPGLYEIDFMDPKDIDFNLIAKKLTQKAANGPQKVGVNPKEVGEILQLHSYFKYCLGTYAAEVEVNLLDLDFRQSEEDRYPNLLSAKSGNYFWLKQGIEIKPIDVKSITLVRYDRLKPLVQYFDGSMPVKALENISHHSPSTVSANHADHLTISQVPEVNQQLQVSKNEILSLDDNPAAQPSFFKRHPIVKKALIGAGIAFGVLAAAAIVAGILVLSHGTALPFLLGAGKIALAKLGIAGAVGASIGAVVATTAVGAGAGATVAVIQESSKKLLPAVEPTMAYESARSNQAVLSPALKKPVAFKSKRNCCGLFSLRKDVDTQAPLLAEERKQMQGPR